MASGRVLVQHLKALRSACFVYPFGLNPAFLLTCRIISSKLQPKRKESEAEHTRCFPLCDGKASALHSHLPPEGPMSSLPGHKLSPFSTADNFPLINENKEAPAATCAVRNLFRALPGFRFTPFSTQHTMKGRTSLTPGLTLTTSGVGFSETCSTFTSSLLTASSSSCSPSPPSFFCCFSLFFFLASSLAFSPLPLPRPPARR